MSNAGQTCIGIERVYATAAVHDAFVAAVTAKVAGLRPGSDESAAYGPMTMPAQADVVRRHLDDATATGGRAATGGTIADGYVAPTVLLDVPETSAAVQEETFGPTITITKVTDAEQALELANGTTLGLGGSVFTGSAKRGMDLARRMRSGMTSINSVITSPACPRCPSAASATAVRPDPRRGRAARVHPRQGHHPAALRPPGAADELRPPREGRRTPWPGSWAWCTDATVSGGYGRRRRRRGQRRCALAARLTEDRRCACCCWRRRLGQRARGADPAALYKTFRTRRDWNYSTEPQPAASQRRVFWPRGKMLGGAAPTTR